MTTRVLRIFLCLTTALWIMSISNIASAENKTTKQYWEDVGMSFEHLTTYFLNNDQCNLTDPKLPASLKEKAYLGCVYAVNSVLGQQGKLLIPKPTNKDEFGELIARLPENLRDVQKIFGKNVTTLGESEIVTIIPFDGTGLTQVERIKKQTLLTKAVIEVWRDAYKNDVIAAPDFNNIAQIIKNNYLPEENAVMLTVAAINAFLTMANYDFARIEPSEMLEACMNCSEKKFYGIGVELRKQENGLLLVHIIEDGPAARAGLQPGDIVTHVGETSIVELSLEDILPLIKGEKDTSVKLTIKRTGEAEPLVINVVRGEVVIKNVEHKVVNLDETPIGYILLRSFMKRDACEKVKEAIIDLKSQNVEALMLDLRGNGGGMVSVTTCIAGLFLGPNKVVARVKIFQTGQTHDMSKTNEAKVTDLPLVTLIDPRSASASELLAGAFADHDRSLLVGERTYGKGTVQNMMPYRFMEKVSLFITVAMFYQPNGTSNQLHGILPHLPVAPKDVPNRVVYRLEDMSINPVPAEGSRVTRRLPEKIRECMNSDEVRAKKDYGKVRIFKGLDFQFLKAKDVAYCMQK